MYVDIYFCGKVNIWNFSCARSTAFIFDSRRDVLVKVLVAKNVSAWGGLEPPIFGFMPNALTTWAIRARHLLFYSTTGFGRIDIFVVKLTFEIITVCGQQHPFSTPERMFLWKCRSFRDRKCSKHVVYIYTYKYMYIYIYIKRPQMYKKLDSTNYPWCLKLLWHHIAFPFILSFN